MWANKQAVVYLSDIDYLASFDDDLSIVEMLRNVVDEVKANDHLLFTSCNLESFETGISNRLLKDFELLEQNFLNFLLLDPEKFSNTQFVPNLPKKNYHGLNNKLVCCRGIELMKISNSLVVITR